MEKSPPIALKLNVTQNTFGCYGLNIPYVLFTYPWKSRKPHSKNLNDYLGHPYPKLSLSLKKSDLHLRHSAFRVMPQHSLDLASP